MKIKINSRAKKDLEEAKDYYYTEKTGLELEFEKELLKSIALIKKYPFAFRKVSYRLRMHIMQRFPYRIYYQIREKHIIIVSILHFKRDWEYS